jgi:hypothetical protein
MPPPYAHAVPFQRKMDHEPFGQPALAILRILGFRRP